MYISAFVMWLWCAVMYHELRVLTCIMVVRCHARRRVMPRGRLINIINNFALYSNYNMPPRKAASRVAPSPARSTRSVQQEEGVRNDGLLGFKDTSVKWVPR